MNRIQKIRMSGLTPLLGFVFLVSGCIPDETGFNPGPPGPAPCTTSVLCRLQNPADTIGLDSAQTSALRARITGLDTAVVLALTTITLESLNADTVRISLLNDLQVRIDSSRSLVMGALLPLNQTIIDWRGYALAPHTGFVDVTFHGNAFESGFAHLNGKYITLYALGGSKVLVADDSKVVWLGECPAAKRTGTALTCANPLP
jgi:hypothetical protein